MTRIICDNCGKENVEPILEAPPEEAITMKEWFNDHSSPRTTPPALNFKKVTLKCPNCGYKKEGFIW